MRLNLWDAAIAEIEKPLEGDGYHIAVTLGNGATLEGNWRTISTGITSALIAIGDGDKLTFVDTADIFTVRKEAPHVDRS